MLRAIQAHALIHREHRKRNEDGAIVATIKDDYAPIRELMADLLAAASELKIRKQILDTIQAVRVVVARRNDPHSDGAKIREIADELALDKSAAWRRVRKAEQEGYIYNLERTQRPGRPILRGGRSSVIEGRSSVIGGRSFVNHGETSAAAG